MLGSVLRIKIKRSNKIMKKVEGNFMNYDLVYLFSNAKFAPKKVLNLNRMLWTSLLQNPVVLLGMQK